jgi:hypothetical protein
MIQQDDILKLKNIYLKYSNIHDELSSLQNEVQELLNYQEVLSRDLKNIRNDETVLINKIEESTGIKLTQDVLIKIISENEQGNTI